MIRVCRTGLAFLAAERGAAVRAGLLSWAVIAAMPAQAHSPSSGLKGLYAGILHPWSAPSCALLLVAAGLWLGQGRRDVVPVASAAATLLMLLAAAAGLLPALPAVAVLLAAAVLAVLVIADRPRTGDGRGAALSRALAPVGFALAAWAGGPDAPMAPELASLWMLGGMALGCWLMPAYAALAAMALQRRGWTAVGVRVIGAWILAAALLVLALQLRRLAL